MPTTVTKSIGSGGGRDYSTLQSWEDASPANLVTSDQIWRGECYNDSEFSASGPTLTVAGSTTDSTRYKELTAASGQSFVDNANVQTNALRYNQSNGVAIKCTNGYQWAVETTENNFKLSRVQISAADQQPAFRNGTTGLSGVDLNQCILENVGSTSNGVLMLRSGSARNLLIIARGFAGSGVSFDYVTSGTKLTNCTVVRPTNRTAAGTAFATSSSGVTIKNCAAFGFTTVMNSSHVTATTCYTEQTPPTGFTQVSYDTSTGSGFENTSDTTRDFRIKSTSALKDTGTTDSTNAPIDIAGTSRPSGSAYDVGCWEYVTSATDYPESLTETASATETIASVLGFASAQTDTGSATESAVSVAALSAAINELASAADSATSVAALSAAITEVGSASDTASGSAAGDYLATITETSTATDVASAVAAFLAAISESASATDTASASSPGNYTAVMVEAATASDVLSGSFSALATIVEMANATDSINFVGAMTYTRAPRGAGYPGAKPGTERYGSTGTSRSATTNTRR